MASLSVAIGFGLACACAVGLLLTAEFRGNNPLRRAAKLGASSAFVGYAALGWWLRPNVSAAASCLCIGLALGAVGDVLLLGRDARSFRAGAASFAAGHVAYLVAFSTRVPFMGWRELGWLLSEAGSERGSSSFVFLVPLVAWLGGLAWLWPHLGPHRWLAALYSAILTQMTVGALEVGGAGTPAAAWIAFAGVAFFLSDGFVARQRFVKKRFVNQALGHPLYFAAQMALAHSVSVF